MSLGSPHPAHQRGSAGLPGPAALCRTRQGAVCGIWPWGARSARVKVTQWKAASRSAPCPYLQPFQLQGSMEEINGLDGTAGQVPTPLPSACCQLQSVRKYWAGREGSASHGCLEMIDIFMVKSGFLGSSVPPRETSLGSGLHTRVGHGAARRCPVTGQGPGCAHTPHPWHAAGGSSPQLPPSPVPR